MTYGAARPGDVASGLRGPRGPPGPHSSVVDDKVVQALEDQSWPVLACPPITQAENHASQQQDRAHHGGVHLVAV
jgi:hypothetical protein